MKNLIYPVSIAALFLSNMAFAATDSLEAFEQVNNSFAMGITAIHFNYREDVLNADPQAPGNIEEYGNAFGTGINVRNLCFQKLYTDLYGEYAFGNLQYKGFGLYTNKPLSQKNPNNFANIDTKLGLVLLDNNYFQLIPYGGFGFRYWTPDSLHTYYNFKALIGTKINCALSDDLVLSPYVNMGTTLGSHAITKVYNQFSIYQGKAHHKLGNKLISEIGLEINYRLEHELFLTAMISHTHFAYEKSAWQLVGSGSFIEPNSKTNELRVGIGIRFGFV